MRPESGRQYVTAQALLGAADASKNIIPDVAGKILFITAFYLSSVIAAAQVVDLEDTSSAVDIDKVGATWPVGSSHSSPRLFQGLAMPVGKGVQLKPVAAGPSIFALVEGYYELT